MINQIVIEKENGPKIEYYALLPQQIINDLIGAKKENE